ncbi:MAG: hypothetical protein AB8C84_01445 [Oligoflexales bacterium]
MKFIQTLIVVWSLLSCEGEKVSSTRSLNGVEVGVKNASESKIIPHTEEVTVETLNGSVNVLEGTFESPVMFDVKDTGEYALIITARSEQTSTPKINKDVKVCLNISESTLDASKVKISALDGSDSTEVDGVQSAGKICIQTQSLPGLFSVVFEEKTQLGEALVFEKDFINGTLKMTYDSSTVKADQIYFVEDAEKKGVMQGGVLDDSGQEVSEWLSKDIDLCWDLKSSNVTTMTFLDWNKTRTLYTGELRDQSICFKPTNLVGTFILGAQEITGITTEKSAGLSATPVLSLEPVLAGDIVSVYTNENCDGDALVSLQASVGGALSLSPRLSKVGAYQFYARAENSHGGLGACSRSYLSYTLLTDLSAPTGLSLVSPVLSNSSELRPVLQVDGVESGAVVGIYSDQTCGNLLVSGTATTQTIQMSLPTLTEGPHVFYAKMSKSDAPGNCSQVSLSYTVDVTKPVINQANLASGAGVVSFLNTTFNFDVSDASEVYITEDSSCSIGGNWEEYQTSKSVTLPNSNQSNTLYAKFRDVALNETNCISDAVLHDSVAPQSPSLVIDGGDFISETSPNLTLSATDATAMYVTNTAGCNSDGTWENYGVSKLSWTLSQTNALTTVYVKFKDEAGNESSCVNDTVTHDSIAPSSVSIIFSAGTHTSDSTPDLTLSAVGASEMYVTNTAGCGADGSWESYATSKAGWSLGQTNALATVYVKFKDEAGNESNCINDSITHDSLAPSSHSIAIDGGTHIADETPDLTLSAAGASEMYVTNTSGCAADGSWESYATSKAGWSLGQTNATATVYVKFKDEAGNTSTCINDTIVHDNIAPLSPSLTISSGAATSISTTVALSPSAVDASEMLVTNTAACGSGGSWEAYSTTKTGWSLAQTNATATVYAQFKDEAGNESSCVSDTILHDNVAPSAPGSFVDGAFNLNSEVSPAMSWSASSDATSGVAYYEVALGTSSGAINTLTWQNVGLVTSITLTGLDLTEGLTYYATIRATDTAGNIGVVSNGDGFTARTISTLQKAIGSTFCGIFSDNSLKCWGRNENGQAGIGSGSHAGDGSSEMGTNLPFVDLGTGRSITKIATADHSSCAVLDNGIVKCWGTEYLGQLGNESNSVSIGNSPGEMGDSLASVNLGTARTAVDIASGLQHHCAILDNGKVKCWGRNNAGQLGIGSTNNIGDGAGEMGDSLAYAELGTGRTATKIVAGFLHTCAVLDNSDMKCWGYGPHGAVGQEIDSQTGDAASEMGDNLAAIDLGTGRTPVSISAGGYNTCAILDNADLKCWGEGFQGQLGNASSEDHGDGAGEMGDSLAVIDLGVGRTVSQVSVGDYFICAILDNNDLKCWGENNYGQLGKGNTDRIGDDAGEMGDNLSAIDLGTGRHATQVELGVEAACALLDNHTVKCWGNNDYGKLGTGDGGVHKGDGASEMGDSLPAADL